MTELLWGDLPICGEKLTWKGYAAQLYLMICLARWLTLSSDSLILSYLFKLSVYLML